MKKHNLHYALILAGAGFISITGTAIVGSVNAENTNKNTSNPATIKLATTGTLSATHDYTGKDETVFVTTDAAGETKSIFLGSTLYAGDDTLPYNLKITYTLDGNSISATELAGKSGHVKITYEYESVATYQGKNVPFVAMTTLGLDTQKFTNVKLTNAKIIDEENMFILGYGVAGLNANLGTDFLPEGFTIEADVNNFALSDAYTVLTNELLADLDVSGLTTIDGLISSVNQLADGADQLVSGSTALADGASELTSGIKRLWDGEKTLQSGVYALADGISSASDGAKALENGLSQLTLNNDALNSGAAQIYDGILNTINETVADLLSPLAPLGIKAPELTRENYASVIDGLNTRIKNSILPARITGPIIEKLTALKDKFTALETFCAGLQAYTDGVAAAAAGSAELANGLSTISSKMPELTSGIALITSGTETLYHGSVELTSGAAKLRDGINTFKTEGIDRLVNFANNNLAGFTDSARRTVSAARSYHDFGHTNAKSVKFIVKTASI